MASKKMEWFKNISNRKRFWLLMAIVVVGVFLLGWFIWPKGGEVPSEFLEANKQGALIAQDIVKISKFSAENLLLINKLETEGRYEEAVNLVQAEVRRVTEMQKRAYDLSVVLGTMTEALPQIEPRVAMQAAFKAINFETSLIIRLLNYSNLMNELLKVLQAELSGNFVAIETIDGLVDDINREALVINDFNDQYRQAIREFEDLVN